MMKLNAEKQSRAAGAVIPYTTAYNDLTSKWLSRLSSTATSIEARDNYSQISALVDYYNRPANSAESQEINWEEWENEIHTPGVVGKIKSKYDAFMETEYSVDEGSSKVFSKTEKFNSLEFAVTYNYYLWINHYIGHVQ